MAAHNQHFRNYPLLSDSENPQNYEDANFALLWENRHHRNLIGKFFKGNILWSGYQRTQGDYRRGAFVAADHSPLQKNMWYMLTMTWDKRLDHYSLYLNSVLIAKEDQYSPKPFLKEEVGDMLYSGSPAMCYSAFEFYDKALSEQEIIALYPKQTLEKYNTLNDHLQRVFLGKNRPEFTFNIDKEENWDCRLDLGLTNPDDLDHFHQQGDSLSARISNDGLLLETPDVYLEKANLDQQGYLWTEDVFEGDLYLEYEFKILRDGGLSLLMTQASGMNREDFMSDYPRRTSGSMNMVCWEDVRNYHWEYCRDMADVRNDVQCSVLLKNPYLRPLAYGCNPKILERNQWHKLQFLQEDNRIIGAING
ncbi:hypothetical protein BVX99_00465, partial [bacterium F16]